MKDYSTQKSLLKLSSIAVVSSVAFLNAPLASAISESDFFSIIENQTVQPKSVGFYPNGGAFPFSIVNLSNTRDLMRHKNDFSLILTGPTLTGQRGVTIENGISASGLSYIATIPLPSYVSQSDWSPTNRENLIRLLTNDQIYDNACSAIKTFANNPHWNSTIQQWNITPSGLRHWVYEDLRYLKLVSAAAAECDTQKRPYFFFESSARSLQDLLSTADYQSMLVQEISFTNVQPSTSRLQEARQMLSTLAQASANTAKSFAPTFLIESDFIQLKNANSSLAKEQVEYEKSITHDIFTSLAYGAKGLFVRAKTPYVASYDQQLSSYLKINQLLNGPKNLGTMFLYGSRINSLSIERISGSKNEIIAGDPDLVKAQFGLGRKRLVLIVNSSMSKKTIQVSQLPDGYSTKILFGDQQKTLNLTGDNWILSFEPQESLVVELKPVSASLADISDLTHESIIVENILFQAEQRNGIDWHNNISFPLT